MDSSREQVARSGNAFPPLRDDNSAKSRALHGQ